MAVFQICQVQAFNAGAFLTGVAPNGADSEETKMRGMYRIWTGCTDGGLFTQPFGATVHTSMSGRVRNVAWNMPGVTNILFNWVDMDGVTIPFWPPTGTASTTRGFWDPQQTLLILRRGAFQITGTGPFAPGAGAICVTWEFGAEEDIFKDIPGLGSETRVTLFE